MSIQLEALRAAIETVTDKSAHKSGKGYRLSCPAHQGKDRNVYIADGEKKLIIRCYSHQCDPKDIIEAAGLSLSDIYYEKLTGTDLTQHQTQASRRQIKKDLEMELLILLFWLNDTWNGWWPMNEEADPPRVELAIKRLHAATKYFIKEGIQ